MPRLCERPGCSAPAAIAYGMDSEALLVWLAIVPDQVEPIRVGMLCRRHADAMVVPRGWTLDDRREPRPRLFRVAAPTTIDHPSRGRTRRNRHDEPTDPPVQLSFDDAGEEQPADVVDVDPALTVGASAVDVSVGVTVGDIRPFLDGDPDETKAAPWRPVFDPDDDLGGLLQTNSPLLSRAFRGPRADPPAG